MTFTSQEIDALDRIKAMLSHEKKSSRCNNYLTTTDVDAACRKAMVDWCFIVADSFEDLHRETVSIAMSIVDRYLSSGKGRSTEALHGRKCRQTFQLAVIASFYLAVKLHEPFIISMEMLLKLCRGYYTESMMTAMEQDILSSLDWRISLSTTTPMEYVRQFLELLPEWKDASDIILENATRYMDKATAGIYFSSCKASAVGVACLAGSLNDTHMLSSLEKEVLWRQLSNKLDFDMASNQIRKVEMNLLGNSQCCKPRRESASGQAKCLPRLSVSKACGQSPVSVFQAAQ